MHGFCSFTWSDSVESLEKRAFSKSCNALAVGATRTKSSTYPYILTLLQFKMHPACSLEISDITSIR